MNRTDARASFSLHTVCRCTPDAIITYRSHLPEVTSNDARGPLGAATEAEGKERERKGGGSLSPPPFEHANRLFPNHVTQAKHSRPIASRDSEGEAGLSPQLAHVTTALER